MQLVRLRGQAVQLLVLFLIRVMLFSLLTQLICWHLTTRFVAAAAVARVCSWFVC
jgi:hypothetical protein